MAATRVRGWEVRLAEVLDQHAEAPFAWGTSDCLTLVGDVVQALTGSDPMASFRGSYATAAEARRLLGGEGYANVDEALAAQFEEVAPAMARRGDIGVVETRVGKRVVPGSVIVTGVNVTGKSPPARGARIGLTTLPRERLVKAYRVGW